MISTHVDTHVHMHARTQVQQYTTHWPPPSYLRYSTWSNKHFHTRSLTKTIASNRMGHPFFKKSVRSPYRTLMSRQFISSSKIPEGQKCKAGWKCRAWQKGRQGCKIWRSEGLVYRLYRMAYSTLFGSRLPHSHMGVVWSLSTLNSQFWMVLNKPRRFG